MEHLCIRCTRIALRSTRDGSRNLHPTFSRTFSASSARDDEKAIGTSAKPPGQSNRSSDRGGKPSGVLQRSSRPAQGQATGNGAPRIRPTFSRNPTSSGSPQPEVLRRNPQAAGSRTPRSPASGRPGARGKPANRGRSRGEGRSKSDEEGDDSSIMKIIDNYVNTHLDAPQNPTEKITYKPKEMTMEELRADWPDTPLSTTGLTESVQQKIQYLARRLPHGYISPTNLAERLQKGELVRFESKEEKDKVLAIAADMAKQRASMLSERKGEQIEPENMMLEGLNSRTGERTLIAEGMVKGSYSKPDSQKLPLFNSVSQNLVNNGTYGDAKAQRFMQKLQALMPAQGGQVKPAQQRA